MIGVGPRVTSSTILVVVEDEALPDASDPRDEAMKYGVTRHTAKISVKPGRNSVLISFLILVPQPVKSPCCVLPRNELDRESG